MFTTQDLEQLAERGISPEAAQAQIERFATGFPFLEIVDSAREGAGITVLTPAEETEAVERWHKYLADGGDVLKFVPASGAASRMFKALFEFVDSADNKPAQGSAVAQIIENIEKLALYPLLDKVCHTLYGRSVNQLIAEGEFKKVIAAIIKPEGLNYGNLPKGLLEFHKYGTETRTPLEEQLYEGAQTAASADGTVKLHFTVSANHRALFEKKLTEAIPQVEAATGKKFEVSLSEQKPSTDTIAANPDNTPFREDGKLLFRPGGHGALIENLNDRDSAVIFVKNIDNVTPESHREATIKYKQVLGGYLIELHDRAAKYMAKLEKGEYDHQLLREMIDFLRREFSVRDDSVAAMSHTEQAAYIHRKLNRPMRVCGMVRNEGEPGGGPFIVLNADGSASLQILESNQIDRSRPEFVEMMNNATHFNPVDLVCYVRDYKGGHYDLPKYVDSSTGFISSKSSHGHELKAMELPGLWNGAMSDWNTAFVEVPVATFNPVKTLNDLLRPTHQ